MFTYALSLKHAQFTYCIYRDLIYKALVFCIVLITLLGKPVALKLNHSLPRPIVPGALVVDKKSLPLS